MAKANNLSKKEKAFLVSVKKSQQMSLRKYNCINILLLLHKDKRPSEIQEFLQVDRITVSRTKKRYLQSGVKAAIEEEARSGQPLKYTTDQDPELAAMACSPCPQGRKRWTVRLLTEAVRAKPGFKTINRESVRLALKKMSVSLR